MKMNSITSTLKYHIYLFINLQKTDRANKPTFHNPGTSRLKSLNSCLYYFNTSQGYKFLILMKFSRQNRQVTCVFSIQRRNYSKISSRFPVILYSNMRIKTRQLINHYDQKNNYYLFHYNLMSLTHVSNGVELS